MSVSIVDLYYQGAYNSGKPGKLGDFFNPGKFGENSGKFEIYFGNS